jgi:hypothetical protein
LASGTRLPVALIIALSGCGAPPQQETHPVVVPSATLAKAAPTAPTAEPGDESALGAVDKLVAAGDDVAAVAALRALVTSEPRNLDAWLVLAQIYAAHDVYDAALRVLDTAACAADDARAWEVSYQRSEFLLHLRRTEQATEALAPVRSLHPRRNAGVALGGASSRDLYFWIAAWIGVAEGKDSDAGIHAKAYLEITCQNRGGSDCDDVRLIRECEPPCVLGWHPVLEGWGGDTDISVHPCGRAALPTVAIENIAQPADGFMSLPDVGRRFRIGSLRKTVGAGARINVQANVNSVISLVDLPTHAPIHVGTVLALTVRPGDMFGWVLPTMNPALEATLKDLTQDESRRFMAGHVRIAQRIHNSLFVSPRYGIFIPERVAAR